MSCPPSPFPIFPAYENFPPDSRSFPPNVHIRAKLEQLDGTLRSMETCQYAWKFIQSKTLTSGTLSSNRYGECARSIEAILNWSFLVRKRSVFDWRAEDVREFINFFVTPTSAWVGLNRSKRLIFSKSIPHTDQEINPQWRIFVRKNNEAPVERTVQILCSLTAEFLTLISSSAENNLPSLQGAISEASRGATILRKFIGREFFLAKESYVLNAGEVEWLLIMVKSRILETPCGSHVYNKYQRVIFALAVAYYTQTPLCSISRRQNHIGVLSQFKRSIIGEWSFYERPGSNLRPVIHLSSDFTPYLETYLNHLGFQDFDNLPAHPTLSNPGTGHAYSSDTVSWWIEDLRAEAAKSASESPDAKIRVRSYAFLRLNFSLVRRSSLDKDF